MPKPLSSILLFVVLSACGEPGADSVFDRALAGRGGGQTSDSSVTARPDAPRMEIQIWRGLYRRSGEESRFQPCGTTVPLDVVGTPDGRRQLAERFRWNSMWQGRPMYGVMRGAIVTDTLDRDDRAPADSAPPSTVTRFYVTGVDSLMTWEGNCTGVRVPR